MRASENSIRPCSGVSGLHHQAFKNELYSTMTLKNRVQGSSLGVRVRGVWSRSRILMGYWCNIVSNMDDKKDNGSY